MLRFADISLYTLEEEEGPSRLRSTQASLPRLNSYTGLLSSSSGPLPPSSVAGTPDDDDDSLLERPRQENRNGDSLAALDEAGVGGSSSDSSYNDRGGGGDAENRMLWTAGAKPRPTVTCRSMGKKEAGSRLWGRTWVAYRRYRVAKTAMPPPVDFRDIPQTPTDCSLPLRRPSTKESTQPFTSQLQITVLSQSEETNIRVNRLAGRVR
jgi:hypothetical protein